MIFITGTDTGVGKTLVTSLLWIHLHRRGIKAVAVKPVCSGGDGDVRILRDLQGSRLEGIRINHACFKAPLAPGVAAEHCRIPLRLKQLCRFVQALQDRFEIVLVEGCGGLMVPVARDGLVLDWIQAIDAHAVVVGANRLGVINHALLSFNALSSRGMHPLSLVLTDGELTSHASRTNPRVLRRMLSPTPVLRIPYINHISFVISSLSAYEKNFQKTLAESIASGSLQSAFPRIG